MGLPRTPPWAFTVWAARRTTLKTHTFRVLNGPVAEKVEAILIGSKDSPLTCPLMPRLMAIASKVQSNRRHCVVRGC
ncbi:hypothetical protein C6366_12980 [Desulfonatronum sp. SC1]|nr:hypothetical protein C6366_12980 [Desulfonatronum sp. SC1]